MKSIFVATDFSEASRNAAAYAVNLARTFQAKIYLFHAYQAPVQVPESYIFYTTEDVWKTVKALLDKEVEAINPEKDVKIEVCGSEGASANTIHNNAAIYSADLIICGMKGSGKAIRKIFGSTVTALVRVSAIPVLVVPENTPFKKTQHIALASDMDAETSVRTVELLKEIGHKYRSKLSVLWVVEKSEDTAYKMRFRPDGFVNDLKDMDPAFEFPAGNNVAAALEAYAGSHDVDMIAMIPHKHSFLERFFVESITNRMIFHTHTPLLVLPQKKNGEGNVQPEKNNAAVL